MAGAKTNSWSHASFSLKLIALFACIILVVLLQLNLTLTVEGYELPKFSELIASTGLDIGQEQEFSDKQKQLISEMMKFYEEDDISHEEERAILAKLGTSAPSAEEKAHLQQIFLDHFALRRRLNELLRQLTMETSLQRELKSEE